MQHRKPKRSIEANQIRPLFKSFYLDCVCTLDGLCLCKPTDPDKISLDDRNRKADERAKWLDNPPPTTQK